MYEEHFLKLTPNEKMKQRKENKIGVKSLQGKTPENKVICDNTFII